MALQALFPVAAAEVTGTGISLKTAATAAAAAATAAQAYSTYRQGQTAEEIGKTQAEQARLNAISLREKAQFDIEQQRARVRKFKGTQMVNLLSSGVTLEGTALDILADTELQASIDEDIIRHNAELAARGLEQQGSISAFAGSEAAAAGSIGAGSTLLSSAGHFSARRKRGLGLLDIDTSETG